MYVHCFVPKEAWPGCIQENTTAQFSFYVPTLWITKHHTKEVDYPYSSHTGIITLGFNVVSSAFLKVISIKQKLLCEKIYTWLYNKILFLYNKYISLYKKEIIITYLHVLLILILSSFFRLNFCCPGLFLCNRRHSL